VDIRLRRALLAGPLALILTLLLAVSAGAQEQPQQPQPKISQERAIEIARLDPKAVAESEKHPDLSPSASRNSTTGLWEVGFFTHNNEVAQVVIDPNTGKVVESWTGYQVAWRMARGYPGAFGRMVNAPYIWLPLCAIFVLGLLDWRRPFRLAHLDLLVLVAGFGVSHYFFNQGNIGLSVPLAYPPLLYLLGRALWLGFRRRPGSGLRPSLPITVLAVATLLLVGGRVLLNVTDSNVIDVGYSGVIGADRIADQKPIYGNFPDDDQSGDTYGPVAYYAYVPFEQIFPWSGTWDDLPAAHAASIFFDLATIAGLFLLGARLRRGRPGKELGILFAFAWAACPYTAYALESNTNDALVALTLVAALLCLTSPIPRGISLALSGMTKFAPLALGPLFATYGATEARGAGFFRRYAKVVVPFTIAFGITILVVSFQALQDPGLSTFWHRTIAEQGGRDSPFSIWGQDHSLGWLQAVVKAGVVVLAVLVAFRPRRRDHVTVAALGAAVVIGMELTVDHWFYLYIPWFLPFLLVGLLASGVVPLARDREEDLLDSASEPVVADLDSRTHQPDVLVRGVESNRHLRPEGL
jgi:Glycosyltransferase family 87/Peptidase propeptide and YPEB domain